MIADYKALIQEQMEDGATEAEAREVVIAHKLLAESESYTMRTLIIPDLHHNTETADYWLNAVEHDRVIFLGDFFDDHEDTAGDAANTAAWLVRQMKNPDAVFLFGNHDLAYRFRGNEQVDCPGFSNEKSDAIHRVMKREHWNRFRLAHAEQGWLVSHAGFHPAWMKEPTVKKILSRCDKAMRLACEDQIDPILGMGELPGGIQKFGGPLWMDWNHFMPIKGINQIVGHTMDEDVRTMEGEDSSNYCIDVSHGCAAVLLCEGNVQILRKASNLTAVNR